MADAGGKPQVPRAAERLARRDKDIELLCFLGKLQRGAERRFDEHIERAVRIDAGVAVACERLIERFAVLVVRRDVRHHAAALLHDVLGRGRRADMPERACGTRDRVEEIDAVGAAVRHEDVADTLAGQAQRFRPGIADHGVLINVRNERRFIAVKDQFAVRLVGDQVDRMTEFFTLFAEQCGKRFQRFLLINDAGGVVRRVDDDRLRVRRKVRLDVLDVQIEIRGVRGHDDHFAADRMDERGIFGEVRCENDELRIRNAHRLHRAHQRGRSAAGEEQVLRSCAAVEPLVQVLRNRFANAHRAGRGCVSVNFHGVLARRHRLVRLLHRLRCGHGRVADREIIDVFRAELRLLFETVLEQFADARTLCAELYHFANQHVMILPLPLVTCRARRPRRAPSPPV